MEKVPSNGRAYLLVRANAAQLPLPGNSVSLVIATPPHFGEKRVRREEFCTSHRDEYRRLLRGFLAEAARIVKPHGHILLFTSETAKRSGKIFEILQKRRRGGRWAAVRVAVRTFRAHYADVKNFYWEALPIQLYRRLLRRYSDAGQTVAHVFSGSGNSAIAAMELKRKPILIDLHYHRETRRRLNKRMGSTRPRAIRLPKRSSRPR